MSKKLSMFMVAILSLPANAESYHEIISQEAEVFCEEEALEIPSCVEHVVDCRLDGEDKSWCEDDFMEEALYINLEGE